MAVSVVVGVIVIVADNVVGVIVIVADIVVRSWQRWPSSLLWDGNGLRHRLVLTARASQCTSAFSDTTSIGAALQFIVKRGISQQISG